EAPTGDVPELPLEFWFRPDVAAACMDWDLGKIFRYVLDETHISEERFGGLIGRSQAQVWRIANHKSECYDIRVFKAVADAFGCPALLLGLAPSGADFIAEVHRDKGRTDEGDPTDRREFMIWGVSGLVGTSTSDRKLSEADVQSLRQVVRDLYVQDDQRGGAAIADIAYRYFRRAEHALGKGLHSSSAVQRSLQTATSELGEAAGWLAFDSGHDVQARACYTEALTIANLIDDELQAVHVLASMSLQATWRNQPGEAIQLAEYSERRALPWATPRLLSMLNMRQARGWAVKGGEAEFRKAIIRAKRFFDRGTHEDDPPWLGYFDYSCLLGDEAFGYADLERYQRSEDYLRLELGQRDEHYGRERALSYARLTEVMLAQGRIREASRTGLDSLLPCLDDVTSVRVLTKAAKVRNGLEPYAGRFSEANDFVYAFDQLSQTRRG
ncbi:MAG: tetratricopeptide repeat protein, partial [Streptosporangiaceae bacterium]|nr:tetratricopeptide repeat protein [Streptosporangiaceae bacterium]